MQKKFVPLAFVIVGLLASFLPIISLDVTGPDAAVVAAMEEAGTFNAWGFDSVSEGDKTKGLALLIGLALVGIFAGLIAAKGLRRGLAIPMTLLGGLACVVASMMVRGAFFSKVRPGGYTIIRSADLGMIIILCVFAAIAGAGIYGMLEPDRA